MILPSDETELSTKDKPDEENSLSTKESFTGKIGVTIGDLDKYKKDSLINIWKDANAYYSSGEEWTDEDAEFFDELAVRINTATEEGIGTVSGPTVGMVANKEFDYKNNEDEKAIKDEGLNGDDGLGFGQHNESFNEEDHPRDESGQFTSGSGSNSGSSDSEPESDEWSGDPDTNPFKDKSVKDIIKSIKGGSKNWQDWKFDEHIPEMAEIEKRNKEIPRPEKPEGYTNEKIFRDDPNAIQKMEAKIKYLENVADYWKQVTKFPVRDFGNKLGYSSLGDQKWYAMSNNSQLLNGTRKKLEQIKNQGTLTRNTTYKSDQYGKSKPRFYYTEEPKTLTGSSTPDEIKTMNDSLDFETEGHYIKLPNFPFKENGKWIEKDIIRQVKPDLEYPEKSTHSGMSSELDLDHFEDSSGKMIKSGDEIEFTDQYGSKGKIVKTIVKVTGFNYDDRDEWEPPNIDGYVISSTDEEEYPLNQAKRGGNSRPDEARIRKSSDIKMKNGESLDQILLNENYIQDQFGVFYRPVYVGENYKEHKSDLVFEGKLYTNEGVGNCPFCKGAGKITVEKLGLKDCPDCDGTGDIQGEQEMPPQMEEPVEEEKPNPFAKGGETKLSDWDYHIPKVAKNDQTWTGDIIEDNPYDNDGFNALSIHDENNCPIGHCPNHDDYRVPEDKGLGWGDLKRKYGESKANEEGTSDGAKKGWDTRGRGGSSDEDKVDNLERHHSDFMQRKGFVSGKQIEGVWEEYKSEMMPLIQQQGEITGNLAYMLEDENNHNLVRLLKDEFGVRPSSEAKASNSCGCKTKGLEANISKYEKFIKSEINVLKTRAKAGEAVGLMYGLPTVRKNGKKIKGTLAYAGVSLNDRIYLPEELAKGHGKTLPLLLNHSSTAGAEEELDRLDGEMRDHLENEKDYEVGEVTLTWDADKLTLFYEGVIENKFFQKEVDDMDMAVSLGIFYDSDSPKVCDEECYTLIKGAEFREVSLVYHAGFPIATIEAVESKLKRASIKDIKASEYHFPDATDSGKRITDPDALFDEFEYHVLGQGGGENAEFEKSDWLDYAKQQGLDLTKASLKWHEKYPDSGYESKANEDSLIKIEDNEDADTQVTILDEWKNETDPDVNGETKGIRTTKAKEYYLGDKIKMTDDAIDNYGQQYKDKSFTISHIANSVEDHMGYDEGMGGENLYDLDELEFSLYDYEVESASESKASEELDEEEDEMPLGGSVNAEPKETDTVEQPIIVESVQTPNSFSVRGVSGMTISNSNGVEKYSFDPTHNYSTNTVHFSVTEQGGTIFGEEIQMQPKMTTPDELTKEIESKPDIKFTDADEDILKKN